MRLKLLPFAFLIIVSCSRKSNNQDDLNKNVISLQVDDPKVEKAYTIAQDSLGYYIDYFKEFYGQENYSFFLKKKFEDNGEFEHMWSEPIEINEKGFKSILNNEPDALENYAIGDTIQIDFGDIEDFIIQTADTIEIGNYLQKELAQDQ